MDLFFLPDLSGEYLLLPEDESRHCIRVLRKKKGEALHLTDGKGNLLMGEIINDHPKRCEVKVVSIRQQPKPSKYLIHVAMAPTKNLSRIEWAVEKMCEMGIASFTSVICEHSEGTRVNMKRLEKIMISAMLQSNGCHLPILRDLLPFPDLIQEETRGIKLIGYCGEQTRPLTQAYEHGKDAVILIGPEGDFSEEEIQMAASAGFVAISLGKSRLRTETAGVMACAAIHTLNGL